MVALKQTRSHSFKMLHDNKNYSVRVAHKAFTTDYCVYHRCYEVVNKETEVVEYYCPTLPDAIHYAEHLNQALETKAWEWVGSKETNGVSFN